MTFRYFFFAAANNSDRHTDQIFLSRVFLQNFCYFGVRITMGQCTIGVLQRRSLHYPPPIQADSTEITLGYHVNNSWLWYRRTGAVISISSIRIWTSYSYIVHTSYICHTHIIMWRHGASQDRMIESQPWLEIKLIMIMEETSMHAENHWNTRRTRVGSFK